MRTKSGLSLFTRTSDPCCFSIASYHSPHSLTWSWSLSFHFFRSGESRWRCRAIAGSHRHNCGMRAWFCVPVIGVIRWERQHPMYYRDLYLRLRDKLDHQRYEASQRVRPMPQRPTVIDGGRAVH
jgi:hypothetical protein